MAIMLSVESNEIQMLSGNTATNSFTRHTNHINRNHWLERQGFSLKPKWKPSIWISIIYINPTIFNTKCWVAGSMEWTTHQPRVWCSKQEIMKENIYRKVASTNMRYWLKNQLFVKRSQYIRIENPLHKRSEKACMCFNTRRACTRDYTVLGP